MDRKDLKIQALRERISVITTEYEDKNADLRVELTVVSEQRDEFLKRLQELENASNAEDASGTVEPDDVS
jgi:hypothetical protein